MRDPLVLMTERRAEQRILAVVAFYIVQSGFGCNCLGRGSDRTSHAMTRTALSGNGFFLFC